MKKQEAIEKLESRAFDVEDTDLVVGLRFAQNTIKQIDEPEKPIVPQFVADWYEKSKNDFENNLAYLINDYFKANIEDNDLRSWFGFDLNKDQPIKTLVNMHQFGYKVEKEKLYTVEFPNPNSIINTLMVLVMNGFDQVIIREEYNDEWKKDKAYQLTEAEIKKDFDWAWQFAEEVEECG